MSPAVIFAILLAVLFTAAYAAAYWVFPTPLGQDPTRFGTFGDFFGGMLNPLLSFLSFVAVLYTVRVQRIEAKAAEADRRAEQEIAQAQLKQMQHEAELNDKARRLELEIAQAQLGQIRQETELNEITRLITVVEADLDRMLNLTVDMPPLYWQDKYKGLFVNYLNNINYSERSFVGKIGEDLRNKSPTANIFIRTGEILATLNEYLIAYTAERPNERLLKHYREKYLATVRPLLYLSIIDREDVSLLLHDDDLGDAPLYPLIF